MEHTADPNDPRVNLVTLFACETLRQVERKGFLMASANGLTYRELSAPFMSMGLALVALAQEMSDTEPQDEAVETFLASLRGSIRDRLRGKDLDSVVAADLG